MKMPRFTIVNLILDADLVEAETVDEVVDYLQSLEDDNDNLEGWLVQEWSCTAADVLIESLRADRWLELGRE